MTKAFSGVRILDFTQVLAGPFANGAPLARGLRKSKVAGFKDAFIR